MSLRIKPVLEAIIVNVADGARAFACKDKGIRIRLLGTPAESTLDWVLALLSKRGRDMSDKLLLSIITYLKSFDVFTV